MPIKCCACKKLVPASYYDVQVVKLTNGTFAAICGRHRATCAALIAEGAPVVVIMDGKVVACDRLPDGRCVPAPLDLTVVVDETQGESLSGAARAILEHAKFSPEVIADAVAEPTAPSGPWAPGEHCNGTPRDGQFCLKDHCVYCNCPF